MSTSLQILISFIITWLIGLTPPLLFRYAIFRGPVGKWLAISIVAIFYLINIIIFIALGSESEFHSAVFLIGLVSFYILRKKSSKEEESSQSNLKIKLVVNKYFSVSRGWSRLGLVLLVIYWVGVSAAGIYGYISSAATSSDVRNAFPVTYRPLTFDEAISKTQEIEERYERCIRESGADLEAEPGELSPVILCNIARNFQTENTFTKEFDFVGYLTVMILPPILLVALFVALIALCRILLSVSKWVWEGFKKDS